MITRTVFFPALEVILNIFYLTLLLTLLTNLFLHVYTFIFTFFFSVTSVCKQSHVFQNFNRGRLLSSKGNNSSFIQKQFIRGAPRNKGDPPQQFVRGAPRHKTDAQQHLQSPGSVLTKHFLMSATVRFGL